VIQDKINLIGVAPSTCNSQMNLSLRVIMLLHALPRLLHIATVINLRNNTMAVKLRQESRKRLFRIGIL
jgi:hypothetical protein